MTFKYLILRWTIRPIRDRVLKFFINQLFCNRPLFDRLYSFYLRRPKIRAYPMLHLLVSALSLPAQVFLDMDRGTLDLNFVKRLEMRGYVIPINGGSFQ